MDIKRIFVPLTPVNNKLFSTIAVFSVVVALAIWQFTADGLIPTPSRIGESVMRILGSNDFYNNAITSLALTLKGMFYSIIIALLVCYLSLIPFFNPIAKFITKCRYLTLTGLIFL